MNIVTKLEELKSTLETNVNVDWTEANPTEEFQAMLDTVNDMLTNVMGGCRTALEKKGYFLQNVWSPDDIVLTGEEMGYEISEEQVIEIWELIARTFDATIGVNWDVIEMAIENYFEDKK